MKTIIQIKQEHLNKINKLTLQLEGEGFWIDEIDPVNGRIIGRAECSNRFKAFDFVDGVETIDIAKDK